MVDQHKDKVADTDDTEARIDLKKRVWQMRVCQRKTAARIATQLEDEGIDAATVEAFAGEVETLRARHGLHWTWFEQELLAGHFDLELRGKSQDSLHNVLLPPSMSDSTAFPSLGGGSVTTAIGSKCTQRASPTSSARSTPKLRPKASPLDSPEVHKKQMPPVEVWLAAEKHRKSNFFWGSCVWQVCRFQSMPLRNPCLYRGARSFGFGHDITGLCNCAFRVPKPRLCRG